jgi:hypothetical protein
MPLTGRSAALTLPPPSFQTVMSSLSSRAAVGEVAGLRRGQECAQQPRVRLRRRSQPPPAGQPPPAPAAQLPAVGHRAAEDLGDQLVRQLERFAQHEHGPLGRGHPLHQVHRGVRDAVAQLGRVHRPERSGRDRLGQPRADVGLPGHLRRLEVVERDPGHHGEQERARVPDVLLDPGPSGVRVLDDVLRVPHAAEHPVRGAE